MPYPRREKKLLPHIYELTRVMDTLREAAKKESDPDGELRVVSGETLLSYRMPQVLQRFRQRAPKSAFIVAVAELLRDP